MAVLAGPLALWLLSRRCGPKPKAQRRAPEMLKSRLLWHVYFFSPL
jgi:hypothetical protein